MNGHLLVVDAGLAARMRADPRLVESVVMQHSFAAMAFLSGDLVADADAALADAAPGCLWGWWPGFLRRALVRRLTRDARAAPSTPEGRGGPFPSNPSPRDLAAVQAELARLQATQAAGGRPSLRVLPGGMGHDDDDDDTPALDAAPIAGAGARLSLDKDWHVVHYLLAGRADGVTDGVGMAVLGGEDLGEDLGYGPARLLDPTAVRAVAADFGRLPPAAILARWDRRAMERADVYSAEGAGKGIASRRLVMLAAFYAAAAKEGKAVLAWLS
jgi:hypothetical protein